MAIQPIRLFGDPILATRAQEVDSFDKEIQRLVADLTDTMLDAPGAGLAAPQIGVSLRVFTWAIEDEVGHLINPVLTLGEEEQEGDEGCLSIPKTMERPIRTIRAAKVVVQTDNLGELTFQINPEKDNNADDDHKVSLETLQTVIVQHEIDHINGKTTLEYLSRLKKEMALKKVMKYYSS